MIWRILCESPDLAVQCLTASRQLQLSIETQVEADPCKRALAHDASEPVAIALVNAPELGMLVELASASRGRAQPLVLALPVPSERRARVIDVASELGMYAVAEVRPLLGLLALIEHGGTEAYAASVRGLSPTDRARLKPVLSNVKASAAAGHLSSVSDARIGWSATPDATPQSLGEPWEAAEALVALRRRERQRSEVQSSVDDVDARAVLDIIFGPKRALSDPASKQALAPYGIPLPVEELCSSPSRAAAEAVRIGYPVRISLASPELRVWDHPDLCVDMVDNAPRVRDTFRQLMAAAHSRLGNPPGADDRRVLGVMVTATSEASALLGVRVTPLPQARVAAEIGFADPHGRAAADTTVTILPAEVGAIERALQRLAGNALLLSAAPALRKARVEAIADVLLRLASFVNDRRREVEAVEVRPLAVLLDGSVEVREACIAVSDYFERSLVDPGFESPSRRV
ncbi:MAG TPA: acetate--CoA ligase family protein [Polyangiales bacterium]|nr:acetate--CoA ligase family protein [Polyangiales bacterium]